MEQLCDGSGGRYDLRRFGSARLRVAYEVMARRSKFAPLNCEDVVFQRDGTGRALIRRSDTDQAGEGSALYLSRTTAR